MQNKTIAKDKRPGTGTATGGRAGGSAGNQYLVLDTMLVSVADPQSAVKTFTLKGSPRRVPCDIFIAGGGVGGVAAALAATASGATVCLAEETDWLGGQMTSQGVSALDENKYVEISGANLSYQELRNAIRRHYHEQATATPETDPYLNPGNCWVSRLSFEPKVAVAQLVQMLGPAIQSGCLSVRYRTKVVAVKKSSGKLISVLAVNLEDGSFTEFQPRVCLDATELGDLLELSGLSYSTGSDTRGETGEAHAPHAGDPENVQDFVYPFVVEFRPQESHILPTPTHYEEFKEAGKFSFQGYKMFAKAPCASGDGTVYELLPFWEYRRLIDKARMPGSPFENDLAMINWDSNDLRGMNIIDKPPAVMADRLAMAKSLSLSFLFWLQTEAQRDEGGRGYPELCLRTDILGTADGLSKYPYIRESRRIHAVTTVYEHDIAASENRGPRAYEFEDSVGIGLYPIDIHGREEVPGQAQASSPFQIPLGALIPQDCTNLLAACKNIGTTHITNGAYRLHPIEWAVGEAAGLAASLAIKHNTSLKRLRSNKRWLNELQAGLARRGAPLYWYDDVSTTHQQFAAIQLLAVAGIMRGDERGLRFRPDDEISLGEAAQALAAAQKIKVPQLSHEPASDRERQAQAVRALVKNRFLPPQIAGAPPDTPLSDAWLAHFMERASGDKQSSLLAEPISRAAFAAWLYETFASKD